MSVEVYQGTITITNADTYQKAVKEIFSMAGYSVTPDATSHKVTVDNGGNIFGHGTFKLGDFISKFSTYSNDKIVMVIDKDQHVLIVSQSSLVPDTYSNADSNSNYMATSQCSIICLLCGDIDDGNITDKGFEDLGMYVNIFNFPRLKFSRVAGQPCIVTPCIDMHRYNLSPVFIAANGVVYPLGTYVTDGSTKFVSNGNGLLIKVKE